MSNRFLGEATANINGKIYTLRCDFNAMCDFEEATGQDALKLFASFEEDGVSVTHMRQMMLSFMKHHHPEATKQEAGEILSEDTNALMRVIQSSSPTPEETEGMGKPKAAKARAA